MRDIKRETKKQINAAAGLTKKVASTVVDKSKDVTHALGQKLQDGGKRLKRV